MKRLVNIGGSLPPLLFLGFLIFLWETIARMRAVPEYLLPLPSTIAKALGNNFPLLLIHTKATLMAAGSGLCLAIIIAFTLGFFLNKFKLLKSVLYPLLVASQTIPIIALAPIIMIWFGLGLLPKILIVTLVCFFPLVINVTEGLEDVDQDLIELLQVMGANSYQIFRNIQLPGILPYFFSGLKISATYSVMGAVIGEWLGGNKGLGVYMLRTMHTFSTSKLFAAIFMVVLLSFGVFKLVEILEKLLMPWRKTKATEME